VLRALRRYGLPFLRVVGGRGQAQIWVFWPVLGGLAGGERCWSSTALITSRFTPAPDAAGGAPGPGRCTGWRGNRAGVTDDGPPGRAGTASPDRTCGANARVADLAHHRL